MPAYVVEALIKTATMVNAKDIFEADRRARAVLRGEGKNVDSITNVLQVPDVTKRLGMMPDPTWPR